VNLTYDGGSSLTVNAGSRCPSAQATGLLGQNGEDAAPTATATAAAVPGQGGRGAPVAMDVDVYDFPGLAGETVEVKLDRQGSGGSVGEVATLRVLAQSGGKLGERTGALPLALRLALPGPIHVVVLRQAGNGVPFRGYYALEVTPEAGEVGDRLLEPRENVEE
jgi:hypothetical protein